MQVGARFFRIMRSILYTAAMFDPVDPKQSFPDLERAILQYWREEAVFQRSLQLRQGREAFSFYDGPPFATGLPHYGHLLAGTIKDVIPRYQTMRGKFVQRRFGWDCHGLPVENLIEQENGLKSKQNIEEMGVGAFNDLCRTSVMRYAEEWRKTVERTGRWVDMDWDYRTMDPDYMESIWWVFAKLYEKNLIYEGRKAMHVCPRCVTPLSNFEVTQGYKDIDDTAATWKFKLKGTAHTFVLAWTTTPWSTLSTMGLSIHPDARYVKIRTGDEEVIIGKERVQDIMKGIEDYEIIDEFPGSSLVGKEYEHIADWYATIPEVRENPRTYHIYAGDYVDPQEGTGIVTINGAYGEVDMEAAKRNDLPIVMDVDMNGQFNALAGPYAGMNVRDAVQPIIEDAKAKGLVWRKETIRHSYPHCWRCDSPLLNYATSSWFVSVEKIKEDMLNANAKTEWVPSHIRDGRFGNWLEGARDWAISRSRYWGTPLPVWRCAETGHIDVIGSRDDLMAKCRMRFTKITTVRHGEGEHNVGHFYQSEAPGVSLTKTGIEQADRAGAFLASKNVNVIYCSPLNRTKQTAERIARATGATVVVDERLREVGSGPYEEKAFDDKDLAIIKLRRQKKLEDNAPESVHHLPGMESWEDVRKRTESFLAEILPRHRSDHVVIVSHADPIMTIRHFFTKEDTFKLSHRPFPTYATPESYFYDHDTNAQMDLHKDKMDAITWPDRNGNLYRRIPDVLDCWFESGSMPYAEKHFPFEQGHTTLASIAPDGDSGRGVAGASSSDAHLPHVMETTPPGFPADFIAEGIDQTRGWFYTLTVLSSALFREPAFRHCIVNGIVLAEDGRKMSKRLKNYPEPTEVVERHGADALRFALMSSPAVRGEDLRFSEKIVEETVRSVLLPLWNSYSFFVTYANLCTFTPVTTPKLSNHPLDRWIRAEVQDLVNRMTEQLDRYDLSATCAELYETIDALTNWYIRLSRRRFAGKGISNDRNPEAEESFFDDDRSDALTTLHDVLITLSQVLAPFCPFVTDAIYLNLVPEEHGSIHLTDWPAQRALSDEERQLLRKNRMLRSIVSLGLQIRAQHTIKIRQPLARATVALPPDLHKDGMLTSEDLALLRQELNVKEIVLAEDAGSLGTAIVMVDARKVGPRLGKRVQEVIRAGKEGNFTLREDGSILILEEILGPDEASIIYRGTEGQNIAAHGGIVVSLETALTDDLKTEGFARDLIRFIQRLRKEAGLSPADTIALAVEGADALMREQGGMIAQETKAILEKNTGDAHSLDLNGVTVTIRFTPR